MTATAHRASPYDVMTVDLPDGELDGLRVERFTVGDSDFGDSDFANFRLGARATRPGTYTQLKLNGRLWMSDTDAEKRDHMPAMRQMQRSQAKTVLINGLGLGMIVKAALSLDHVERVDVVERDERVVKLVGGHYAQDARVTVHHADAYQQARRWPTGSRWDVIWSDIWPDLCTDNLADMARLRRSYGRRCDWHECWGRDLLLRQRRQDRNAWWNR